MKQEEPIRIAQIIGKMWAGGVETVVFNYYRALDHNKVQFDFYYDADSTVEPPEDIIEMGAHFYKLSPYQKIWRYLPELKKYFQERNYIIVHSHLNTLSVFPLFIAWIVGIPVRIAHNHSVPGGNEWKRNVIKLLLKKFSKVFATDYFACSEKAGYWLFGNKTFKEGKVKIIKNAIDFQKFSLPYERKRALKESLGLTHNVVYGHIGRFTFAKNHMKLLDIFKILYIRNNNAKLLLVGDGELHDQIYQKINKLALTDSVICVGKVQNPEVYYSVIDVMILPSYFEGFSMTTIESQVSGVPIVISKAIPIEAVISDSCQYRDLKDSDESWADAAESLLNKTVELNDRSYEFDIHRCAPLLQDWYLENYKLKFI